MPSARQFVTPVKAEVQGKRLESLDSRLRGNDGTSDVALISTILSQALSVMVGQYLCDDDRDALAGRNVQEFVWAVRV